MTRSASLLVIALASTFSVACTAASTDEDGSTSNASAASRDITQCFEVTSDDSYSVYLAGGAPGGACGYAYSIVKSASHTDSLPTEIPECAGKRETYVYRCSADGSAAVLERAKRSTMWFTDEEDICSLSTPDSALDWRAYRDFESMQSCRSAQSALREAR